MSAKRRTSKTILRHARYADAPPTRPDASNRRLSDLTFERNQREAWAAYSARCGRTAEARAHARKAVAAQKAIDTLTS